MSNIYASRYFAEKERKENPFFNGSEKVVKVDGGFVLMDQIEYREWKNQK